jgi:type I restriction enzyme R subunit
MMTTRLEGPRTKFLPFNRGNAFGAGNPPRATGYATSYLWEQVWARDSVLNLLQYFVHEVEEEDDAGHKHKKLIFPRFHQLDCVRRLIADARERGQGQRYLIQHSAGSGKSNSIAWLAHQLASLHDDKDKRVFDSIVIISDRRVIDRQLQATVKSFEQTAGLVENIDETSRQLKAALEAGKAIVVTTLQKFPVIAEEIKSLPGARFAVIIDEAHSSQTGESRRYLNMVFKGGKLEDAELVEGKEWEDDEDVVLEQMKSRGFQPNVSYFAFAATPKAKTLEMFGKKRTDGRFEPFSLYPMRQAIEESFILDVLENYTTYHEYWNLWKTIADDPRYDKKKAQALLRSFVTLHPHAIEEKLAIILEHFDNHVADRIGGTAKAMIVTRSRLHAVRFFLALRKMLGERKAPYKALVAFSGTVRDGGCDYTEAGLNGFSERQTAGTFKKDEYRFMVVAEKFQTGFDQPLLHTMYVDRKLGGVHAVQTLSRLNRVHPGKGETMVLDFANTTDEIQKAFEPYYEKTLLSKATDPNLLYDKQSRLAGFGLYSDAEVKEFGRAFFDRGATQAQVHALLDPIVERYKRLPAETQLDFRSELIDYVRLYAFLSQIVAFADADLERFYQFARLLRLKLPIPRLALPVEIQQAVDMDSHRLEKTSEGKVKLAGGEKQVEPAGASDGVLVPGEELEQLSLIPKELNDRFGTDFKDEDKVFIAQLEESLAKSPALEASERANPPENARLTFDQAPTEKMQDMIDTNFKFYKQVNDNPEFGRYFLNWLFDRYRKRRTA